MDYIRAAEEEAHASRMLTIAAENYAHAMSTFGPCYTVTHTAWADLLAAHKRYEDAHRDASRAYHQEEWEAGLL